MDTSPNGHTRLICLTMLGHPDPERIGEIAFLPQLANGEAAELSRSAPRFSHPGEQRARSVEISHISRKPMLLVPAGGHIRLQRQGVKTKIAVFRGAGAVLPDAGKGLSWSEDEIEAGVVLQLGRRLTLLIHRRKPVVQVPESFGISGQSEPILDLRRRLEDLAEIDVPVLIRGESGSGKELVARALEQRVSRRGPFLSLNMAAIPPNLAASELFGVERGAFSGADRNRPGYFQKCHRGTLFLDEIGDAPPEVQAALLRALESGDVQKVGGRKTEKVDVRILAATDAPLEKHIESGSFRDSLLHRLNACQIAVPPLRDRRDDIPRLALKFIQQELTTAGRPKDAAEFVQHLSPQLMARLSAYDWPGNVRELLNVIRGIVFFGRRNGDFHLPSEIDDLLPKGASPQTPVTGRDSPEHRRFSRSPKDLSHEEVLSSLEALDWNVQTAAKKLGVSKASLYLIMRKIPEIKLASELSEQEIRTEMARCSDLDHLARVLRVSLHGLKLRMKELEIHKY